MEVKVNAQRLAAVYALAALDHHLHQRCLTFIFGLVALPFFYSAAANFSALYSADRKINTQRAAGFGFTSFTANTLSYLYADPAFGFAHANSAPTQR